jgi:hypothetical protein
MNAANTYISHFTPFYEEVFTCSLISLIPAGNYPSLKSNESTAPPTRLQRKGVAKATTPLAVALADRSCPVVTSAKNASLCNSQPASISRCESRVSLTVNKHTDCNRYVTYVAMSTSSTPSAIALPPCPGRWRGSQAGVSCVCRPVPAAMGIEWLINGVLHSFQCTEPVMNE